MKNKIIVFFVLFVTTIIVLNPVSASNSVLNSDHKLVKDKVYITLADFTLNKYSFDEIYKFTDNVHGYLITLDNESYSSNVSNFINFAHNHGMKVIVTYTELYDRNGTLIRHTYQVPDADGVLIITNNADKLSNIVDKMSSSGYKNIIVLYTYLSFQYPVFNNQTNKTEYKTITQESIPLDKILNNDKINGVIISFMSQDKNKLNEIVQEIKSKGKDVYTLTSIPTMSNGQYPVPVYDMAGEQLVNTVKSDKFDYVIFTGFDSLVPSVIKYTSTSIVGGSISNSEINSTIYDIIIISILILWGFSLIIVKKSCPNNDNKSEITNNENKTVKETNNNENNKKDENKE